MTRRNDPPALSWPQAQTTATTFFDSPPQTAAAKTATNINADSNDAALGNAAPPDSSFQNRRASSPPPAPPRRTENLIIVGCGLRKKRVRTAPAGELYTGSFHQACRTTAQVLAGPHGRIRIISAKYGLLRLEDVIAAYDLRLGQPASITPEVVAAQAEAEGLLHAHVTVLAGRAYANVVKAVWKDAATPLEGCRGIGEMQARLVRLRTGPGVSPAPRPRPSDG